MRCAHRLVGVMPCLNMTKSGQVESDADGDGLCIELVCSVCVRTIVGIWRV